VNDPRPSWGYCPDDLSWSEYGWRDRARVVAIVLGVIVVFLAGSVTI